MDLRTLFAEDQTQVASVGTSFSAAKKSTLDLDVNYHSTFYGNMQGIYVKLSAVSSATKLTMRICTDAAGDDILIPDTEADIALGITTANKGYAAFGVDLDIFTETETYYVFYKVDAGSVTVDKVVLTYRREI
tara:strand:+ start:1103 stop:1501 length:399 start_codon:yes stop_codon:yes gene_type:complete